MAFYFIKNPPVGITYNPSYSTPKPLTTYISNTMIKMAVVEGNRCPLTLDPILATDAIVTSCGHVFSRTGWVTLNAENRIAILCPVCRQTCVIE